MSARDPHNVPIPELRSWAIAGLEPASDAQVKRLDELLEWECVDPIGLFGADFVDTKSLGKWSAHWGIEQLLAMANERALAQADREATEAMDDRFASWYANYMRALHPQLRRPYARP